MPKSEFRADNPYLSRQSDAITIANLTIDRLSAIAAGQPFYCYDGKVIRLKIEELRKHLPPALKLHYAIKANPHPAVVNFCSRLLDGLDVASQRELQVALASSMTAEDISFAGPGKTNAELLAAISAGVTINAESEGELRRIETIAKSSGVRARVALRINPSFQLKSSGMKMGGGPQAFGIDFEEIPRQIAALDHGLIELEGFHIYAGSQNLNEDAIIQMHNETFAALKTLVESCAEQRFKHFNIGGGLGIPYFPGEARLSLRNIGENLEKLMKDFSKISNAKIIMELGRFIVGESGIYVAKIVEKKYSRQQCYLVCDGGLHHHLALSGNFGQVIRKNYPVEIHTKAAGDEKELVNIVGPLCTPLDILGSQMLLPRAEVGDYVVVLQSGAYGATASPIHFLSHPPAQELFFEGK